LGELVTIFLRAPRGREGFSINPGYKHTVGLGVATPSL
jgi:hypothetical protein